MFNKIRRIISRKPAFQSSAYWEGRYKAGDNSGPGSYNHLAEFKAEVINGVIKEFSLSKFLEFGCGDGNQLGLLFCEKYIGLDVSITALELCKRKYKDDKSKSFFLYNHKAFVDNAGVFKVDASMSLDVLFHLVEQNVYDTYLVHLFGSASKMVIIYAADMDIPQKTSHEIYRKFTRDIQKRFPDWELKKFIKNRYPAANYEDQYGSLADFFIYTPIK